MGNSGQRCDHKKIHVTDMEEHRATIYGLWKKSKQWNTTSETKENFQLLLPQQLQQQQQ